MKLINATLMLLNKRKYIPFLLFSLFIIPLLSEERERSNSINLKCLSCHSIDSTCEYKFRINENYFFASVHVSLRCTDCHQASLRDTEEGIPHEKDLPVVNCISKCHQEKKQGKLGISPLYYPDSVHGKAYHERGVQDAAKCWDCHGKHYIKKSSDLNSRVNRKNIPLICSVCHENMNVIVKYNIHYEKPYQEYMESVHGKALYKDGFLLFGIHSCDIHGLLILDNFFKQAYLDSYYLEARKWTSNN